MAQSKSRMRSWAKNMTADPLQQADPLEVVGIDLADVDVAGSVRRYKESGRLKKLNETIKLTEANATVSSTMLGSIIKQ